MYDGLVLERLAGAIDELVVPPCAEGLEEVLRLRDRLDAKVSEGLRAFDQDQGWGDDGSLSLSAWVAWHGRRFKKDAHREAVAAKRLAQLPLTAAAWADGELSSSQVFAVVANVSADHAALFAAQEADLVPELAQLSPRCTMLAMRAWRLRAQALDDEPSPAERPSELYVSETMDGRHELQGHFCAEDGAVLDEAIKAATTPPWASPQDAAQGLAPVSAPERRAEALVEVCRQFLAGLGQPASSSSGRARPQLNVVVDLEDLQSGGPGRLVDGTPIAGDDVARIACDSVLHRIVMAGKSTVLDYGTATRTVPAALWAALVARDGHCRHPGCDRPPGWCEAHHVVHFKDGGPTRLSNLVLACSRHHHLWHDKAWKLQLHGDGTLDLVSPRGALLTSKPPPVRLVS